MAANGNDSNRIAEWAGDGRHSWPIRGFVLDAPTSSEFTALQHSIVDDVRKVYIAPLGSRRVRISGLCDVKPLLAPVEISVEEQTKKCELLFGQAKSLMPDGFFVEPSRIVFQATGSYVVPSVDNENSITTANIAVDEETAVFHTCLRPQTADDLPVIGKSGKIGNLFYNSGHGHLGLTRGIGSSKLLTLIICGEPVNNYSFDVNLFQPTRFQLLPDLAIVKATRGGEQKS